MHICLCRAYFQENGLAIVISDEGEWTLVKAAAPNGPLTAGLPTMGMVNSRLASEADTSLGTLKISPKCLTASSATPSAVLHKGSSSQAAAAAANDLAPPSAMSKQCNVGVQASIDLPCLVSSKEYAKSNFDLETISTVSSPHISSNSFTSAFDGSPSVESSFSQIKQPSSLYVCHMSDSSSFCVNKNSPPSSAALDSSVWSDDDEEFYDAMNSVSDPMSPKLRSSRHASFGGGEILYSPVESPRHLVFDDCELFESSVDESPMTKILDESVRSGMCEGSRVYGQLKVSSVDPISNQVTTLANSLINDVYNSIELDQEGNLNVQPIQTDKKYIVNNPGQSLEKVSPANNDEINEGAVHNEGRDDMVSDSCNISDSDEDHMPNFVSFPVNPSDEDQMSTDIEYLEDSHPCVKLVSKQGDSSGNELSTDEEILDDDFVEDQEGAFFGKAVAPSPKKKMKKGYKYKTKSDANADVPNACIKVPSKFNSYETSIGGDGSSDEGPDGVSLHQELPADLQPLPTGPIESISEIKPQEQPSSQVADGQDSLKIFPIKDTEGNIPIVQPCGSGASKTDIERETDKLSPKSLPCEPHATEAFSGEVNVTNVTGALSPTILPSETKIENITDSLSSELLINDPLETNQSLLEDHVTEEEFDKVSPNIFYESDTIAPFSDNADIEKEPNKAPDEDLFDNPNTIVSLVDDIDLVDSQAELDEISLKDNLAAVGDNLEKNDGSRREDAKEALCDSGPSALGQKDEEEKSIPESLAVEEVEGISDSTLKASSGVCCVSFRDVTEGSLIDTNNNEGEQNSFRKEINFQISSDTEDEPAPCQSAEVTSSSSNPNIHPVKDDACSIRNEIVSSEIDDLGESTDEDIEDSCQLKYTDDDLFEILDSPIHHPSNTIIQSNSAPETLLPTPKSDDPLVRLHSDDGATNENEILSETLTSHNPLSQSSSWESDSQKNKKAAGSKKLFDHFKPWKKKGKGSKK